LFVHKNGLACSCPACRQIPTATPTQQTTTAPIVVDTNTVSIRFSTVISNITVADFNETAFKAAVIGVIDATVVSTAAATLQVVITSVPQATATAALISDSSSRHLQVTNNSVTVAYDVTNIPDTATANTIQTQLSSTDSNSKLLNSYKTLDNSRSASAITTTVLTKPFNTQPPRRKSLPIGTIVGAIAGILTVVAISYTAWRKRGAISRRMTQKHTTTTSGNKALGTNSIANNTSRDSVGSFSKATTAADNPRRNSSDRRSGSMLIDMEADIVIDSVYDDGTNGNDHLEHATSSTTAAVDDTAATSLTQHKPSVVTNGAISIDVSNDSSTATATASGLETHVTTTANSGTSDIATDNSTALGIQSTSDETTDTVSELAVATKKPFWTKRIGQASRLVTTRMSTVTQKAVAEHGDKAILAYELVGAVAEHIPYVKNAYGLCNEIVQLFGAGVHIDSNCAEVVAWAKHMQVCYHKY
jgi:hypothetical protein